MNIPVHEDKTHKDIWLKLVVAIPLIAILVITLLFTRENDTGELIILFGVVALIFVIFWVLIPRQYVIYEDSVKIQLAGPFSFVLPFDTIKGVGTGGWSNFGLNLPSSLSNRHVVGIFRKKRVSIFITPENRELFIKKMEEAMRNWRKEKERIYGKTG